MLMVYWMCFEMLLGSFRAVVLNLFMPVDWQITQKIFMDR